MAVNTQLESVIQQTLSAITPDLTLAQYKANIDKYREVVAKANANDFLKAFQQVNYSNHYCRNEYNRYFLDMLKQDFVRFFPAEQNEVERQKNCQLQTDLQNTNEAFLDLAIENGALKKDLEKLTQENQRLKELLLRAEAAEGTSGNFGPHQDSEPDSGHVLESEAKTTAQEKPEPKTKFQLECEATAAKFQRENESIAAKVQKERDEYARVMQKIEIHKMKQAPKQIYNR